MEGARIGGSREAAGANLRLASAALAVSVVTYAALAYGYVTLTPIWENPDEPAHYNYVAFVAQTGGLPELKSGDWDSALLERVKSGTLQPGDSVGSIQYENWQPPLFYLLAAPVFRLGPTTDPRIVILRLRAFDAFLGLLTVGIAYLVARQVFSKTPLLAAAVPLTIVGIPMFTAVSAGLSADPLANLLSAGMLLLLARRVCRQSTLDVRGAILIGVVIGLGVLTKLAVAMLIPIAVVVIVMRSIRPVREAAITLATTAFVTFPWLIHQVTTYGLSDPLAFSRHAEVVVDQPRFPGFTPDYLIDGATTTFHSFWAQFGWMAIIAQPRLYVIWGAVTLGGVLGLVVNRRRFGQPVWQLMLATALVAFAGYVGYNLTFEQLQGRYLFTAIVAIAVLLVAGWAAWLPSRWQPPAALLIAAALGILNGYTLLRVLVLGFAPPG